MYGDLLPIGSVVLLKGEEKRFMIVSRIAAMQSSDAIYDYVACAYPEGITDSKMFYYFNRDDIDRLYFIGFQDGEELRFRTEVLGELGELYINEDGKIAERERPGEEGEEEADEAPVPADSEPVAGGEGDVEPPVFAEV